MKKQRLLACAIMSLAASLCASCICVDALYVYEVSGRAFDAATGEPLSTGSVTGTIYGMSFGDGSLAGDGGFSLTLYGHMYSGGFCPIPGNPQAPRIESVQLELEVNGQMGSLTVDLTAHEQVQDPNAPWRRVIELGDVSVSVE